MVADARRGQQLRDVGPLVGRRRREPLSEPAAPRVDAQQLSGLGVDEPERADVRELLLARVAHLESDDVVPARQLEQGPPPVPWPAEIGDQDDEAPLAGQAARAVERLPEVGRSDPRLAVGLGPERRQQADEPHSALPCRQRPRVGASERHDPEPVAAPGRHVPDRDRGTLGDVGLTPFRRPELHRRRGVEDEPRDEHALSEGHADMRLRGPRGDVPVDSADVVAGNVGPHLRELGPVAEQ